MPNIILGLLALAFGLWGLSIWWWSVTELLRGLFPLLLLGVGFVALAAGITKIQHPVSKMRYGPEEDDDLLETDNEVKETKDNKLDSELVKSATKLKNGSTTAHTEEADKKTTKVATTTKSTNKKPSIKKVITAKSTASDSSSSENKSVTDKTTTNIKNTDKK